MRSIHDRWNALLTCFVLGVCLAVASDAVRGGTITFSGRDWTTEDNGGTGYTAIDAETGSFHSAGGTDSGIRTPLALSVGDSVSFELQLTDTPVGGGWDVSAYFYSNDNIGTFNQFTVSERILYYGNPVALHFQSFVNNAPIQNTTLTTPAAGVLFEFVFDSETTAQLTVSNQTSPGIYSPAFMRTVGLNDIADIDYIRIGSWDSEQTVAVSNFAVSNPVPEPAAFALAGLAVVTVGVVFGIEWRRRGRLSLLSSSE